MIGLYIHKQLLYMCIKHCCAQNKGTKTGKETRDLCTYVHEHACISQHSMSTQQCQCVHRD